MHVVLDITPGQQSHDRHVFSNPLLLNVIFITACVIAGIATPVLYGMGGLGIVSCVMALLFFGILLFINIQAGLFFIFAFSLFQPFVTRLIFYVDFPNATEQSMIAYMDPLTTTMSLLLIGVAFLAIISHINLGFKTIPTGILIVIALYALLNGLQIFNPNKSLIAGIYGAKNNVLPLLMLFVSSQAVRSQKNLVRFVKFIAWFSLIALLYGLYQELIGLPFFDKFYFSRTFPFEGSMYLKFLNGIEIGETYYATDIKTRVPSLFSGYTYYSYIIAAFGVIVYAVGKNFDKGSWRLLRMTVLVLLLLYFIFSMERTAIVMFVIGVLGTHFAISREKKKCLKFIFVGSIVLLTLYALLLYSVKTELFSNYPGFVRIAELSNPLTASTVASGRIRGGIWGGAMELIKQNPILGTGAGSAMYTRGATKEDTLHLPHNEYFQKQMELGLFGLILFLAILYLAYKAFMKGVAQENPPCKRAFAAGMVGVLAAYMACGLFNVPFLYEPGIVFWFLAGVALTTMQNQESEPKENIQC